MLAILGSCQTLGWAAATIYGPLQDNILIALFSAWNAKQYLKCYEKTQFSIFGSSVKHRFRSAYINGEDDSN